MVEDYTKCEIPGLQGFEIFLFPDAVVDCTYVGLGCNVLQNSLTVNQLTDQFLAFSCTACE